MLMPNQECPLCTSSDTADLFQRGPRHFWECSNCDLLFAVPDCVLSPEQEKTRYLQHNNNFNSSGYLSHLDKLRLQLSEKLEVGMRGLDFGCGPSPVLSKLLAQAGFIMDDYDPYFAPLNQADLKAYDFIVCSETAEHFRSPILEFRLMNSLLKPQGWIAIMTNLREEKRRSSSWWYLGDQTHRCFYSSKTIQFMAAALDWKISSICNDVIIFSRNNDIL